MMERHEETKYKPKRGGRCQEIASLYIGDFRSNEKYDELITRHGIQKIDIGFIQEAHNTETT